MKNPNAFSPTDKDAVYKAIYGRRDMRHFNTEPVDEAVLQRLLAAAHTAPSVGFMQPWRIIRVNQQAKREQLHQLVEVERENTAEALGEQKDAFMKLKVQGILDCAEVWVVALMDEREQHIFGRRTLPHMDMASASCAIQNVWLAARAEGIGVGWVSIFEPKALGELMGLPKGAEAIAILCIGQVDAFYDRPMLEQEGWAERGNIDDYVMVDHWDDEKNTRAQAQWQSKPSSD